MRNLKDQPDGCRHKNNAGATVADKWQGNALHRDNTDHTADVHNRLHAKPREYTDGN